jgi:hypothetical protein
MVGVLAIFRKSNSFLRFSYFANLGLIAAGIYLLFVQLHGYQHDTNAELFRFPVQEHIHIHEDIEIQNATTSPRNSL